MVEDRVAVLENKTREFEYEIRSINKTLLEISQTLTEIKILNSNVLDVKQEIALLKRNLELLDAQTKKLFDYHDSITVDMSKMKLENKAHETKSELKIGFGERFFWLMISAAVAGWSIFGDKG